MVVQVQAILFASLAASLFSAFLAMLGKQWLNRYASVDMRGSTIERSRNRQRKVDGIVSWYFDHVMESLPLMLQVALLLLGCALSRYLWEISRTVASVVLGVTAFGVIFYLFIAIAGATSVGCPYQTPGAHILRRIPDILHRIPKISHRILDAFCHVLGIFRSVLRILGGIHPAFSALARVSFGCSTLNDIWDELKEPPYLPVNIALSLSSILFLPILLVVDVCRAVIWLLVVPPRRAYFWLWQGLKEFLLHRELEQHRSRQEVEKLQLQ